MPEKSATHQKKVDEAVRILNTMTGVNVPQAMMTPPTRPYTG
jgi:hypothetical protein